MNECGWKGEGCGALALRWGCCSQVKPSCLPRPAFRYASAAPWSKAGADPTAANSAPKTSADRPAG